MHLVGALASLLLASPAIAPASPASPAAPPPPPANEAAAPASPTVAPTTAAPTAAPPPSPPPAATFPPPPVPPPPPSSQAPAPQVTPVPASLASEAAVYQDLQQRTGLDLQRVWTDYQTDHRAGQGFHEFARARFRRRLGAGIALSIAGLGLSAAGIALVLLADQEDREVDVIGGALVITAGFGLAVPGAILWPTSQVRLHKLKKARPATTARLQLRAAGPVVLPRGLGLGLGLAF
ncbi:hypothetical protein [Nannocystis pusilla]|uniref:Uncharacterized protein n=1 Tax=Nannocystis pusilla TaxID=889268 RepID=A0ABS7TW00_9BACT|nr:hypothetical protein [Nannocystis pusilla]MBZ5712354.1 hypothetical protein [Nannocystis pusilla]